MTAERRIVSLVPSLTHMLCDFGLRGSLAGVTNFCIAPPGLRRYAELIGGTKDPDIAAIARLKPTHILVNEEENKPEHIEACRAIAPTFISFPKAPREVPGLLREVSAWVGAGPVGDTYAKALEAALQRLESVLVSRQGAHAQRKRYLYFIWREPYMLAGGDSYISRMLELIGWENAAPAGVRYPEITVDAMRRIEPDVVLLSSEPYPFRVRDAERLRSSWPEAPPMLKVDGQLCSWYGTMTETAVDALAAWVSDGSEGIFGEFRSAMTGAPERVSLR